MPLVKGQEEPLQKRVRIDFSGMERKGRRKNIQQAGRKGKPAVTNEGPTPSLLGPTFLRQPEVPPPGCKVSRKAPFCRDAAPKAPAQTLKSSWGGPALSFSGVGAARLGSLVYSRSHAVQGSSPVRAGFRTKGEPAPGGRGRGRPGPGEADGQGSRFDVGAGP